jgi:hypothetical protein
MKDSFVMLQNCKLLAAQQHWEGRSYTCRKKAISLFRAQVFLQWIVPGAVTVIHPNENYRFQTARRLCNLKKGK